MNKLKQAWNWLKEKWWIPLSGAVVFLVAFLVRPKSNSLFEFMKEDRELEKETEKQVKQLEEVTDKQAEQVREQTKQELKKVKATRKKNISKIE